MGVLDHRILVVDHDARRRQDIERILAGEGFLVQTAAEGFSAVRALGERRFGMIVAALRLPGSLDGVTTVRRARVRQPWLKALFTYDCGPRPGWDRGANDDFIAAPLDRWQLLGCVFELLQRHRAAANADLARRARAELRAS